MKKLSNFLSFVSVLFFISCSSAQTDFYVMESGNDSNPGTREKPFGTIQKAIKAVHESSFSGHSKKITVWIGGGTYRFNETLVLGPDDSGLDEGSVIYRGMPNEIVEFSGGIEIKNWEKRIKGLWNAPLDKSEIGNNDFRELFINGQRAVRARYPNKDFLRVAESSVDRRTNFRNNKRDLHLPNNSSEFELILLREWEITRINLSGINPVKMVKDSIGTWNNNFQYFFENSLAFLDNDGEWYYDRNEELIYLILPEGESPVNKKVIIPKLPNNLLRLAGTETQKVKNVHFENITFNYCAWSLPSEGYTGIQACHFNMKGNTGLDKIPAAIEAKWSENCSFVNCRFSHLGGSGLLLGTGSVECLVSGCQFDDISANGVMIGEGNDRNINGELWWKKVPDQVASKNIIRNSSIASCGRQFFGAVGIWCGLSANTSIINNHVFDLPYTGISVGWMWNSTPTPCRENRVEGNHIHHVMQILSDGGGIYSLGFQPCSYIVNNKIHDIPFAAGSSPSNGIFLDEGTKNIEVSGNLIYKIAQTPLRFHKTDILTMKNNILACSGDNPPFYYNKTLEDNDFNIINNQILREVNPEHMKILESAINKWELKNK